MSNRSDAQLRADAEYRKANPQVLVRLSLGDSERLDKARGAISRAEYAKRALLMALEAESARAKKARPA